MFKENFTQKILLFSFAIFSFNLSAQTTIWEGDVDNQWENPANWSTNAVPTSGMTAVVLASPSGSYFPTISVDQVIDYTVQNFGTITLDAVIDNQGSFTNFGNATIVNKGTFTNFTAVVYQNAGDLINEGNFENKGSLSNFGSAVLTNAASGSLVNRASSSITNFGTVSNAGAVLNEGQILNTAFFHNDGVLQNDNFIKNGITAIFNNNATGTIINNGTFEIGGDMNNAGLWINNSSVEVNSTGTLNNDGEYQNLLNFSNNSGTVNNNGLYINAGVFNNNFGAVINNYGEFDNLDGTLEIFECSFLYQYSTVHPIDGNIWNFGVIYALGAPVNYMNMAGAVVLFDINENPAPAAVCQDIDVLLDDVNGVASISPAEVDGGSTALYCVINGLSIDKENFDCSNVGLNVVTLTVTDFFGNMASCQSNVNIISSTACTVPTQFCTFTQGYYGNANGLQFGQTTIEIITDALSDENGNNNPIILGSGNRTLQVDLEAAQCVIDLLPGGGTPAPLPAENNVLGSNCDTGSIPVKNNGRIDNILIAQTLTLALNTRYDENLIALKLDDACVSIPSSIYNALGSDATIGDLLDHANDVLGGGATSALSDIPHALGNINDYFDECQSACFPNSNISVLDLGVVQTANAAQLMWLTSAEETNESFVIEHSTDGINFEPIEEMNSESENATTKFYETVDAAPEQGLNVYRIKEIHEDGSFNYSNIEVVHFIGDLEAIRIYPNPTTERIFVSLSPFEGLPGKIEIMDARGQLLMTQNHESFPAGSEMISLTNYREGIYFLSVQADGKRLVNKRFMVANAR